MTKKLDSQCAMSTIEWSRPSMRKVRCARDMRSLVWEMGNATLSYLNSTHGMNERRYREYQALCKQRYNELVSAEKFGDVCSDELEELLREMSEDIIIETRSIATLLF